MGFARPAMIVGLAFSLAFVAGQTVHANGTGDPQPAATLLLPYFEVDLDDPENGVNTTFVIRNADPAATLAHVMIFTDLGVGTLAFDVLLTGFDALTVDLREVFNGTYDPDSGNPLLLPTDTPVEDPPPPPTAEVFATDFESGTIEDWSGFQSRVTDETLQAWHTGNSSERNGLCAGVDHGDNIARGYILVDNAIDFSGDRFPDPDYFGILAMGPTGTVSFNDVLWGDFEMTDPNNNFSVGNPLVHIPISEGNNFGGSFYAPYSNNNSDMRLALQRTWGTRYADSGAFTGGASIVYWRGPLVPTDPFTCATMPFWVPRGQSSLLVFDEQSNVQDITSETPFAYAAGRVEVGSDDLPVDSPFGWLYVNFGPQVKGGPGSVDQGIIMSISDSTGRFSVGQYGIGMDNAPITEGDQN